jgi:hypothetical protein
MPSRTRMKPEAYAVIAALPLRRRRLLGSEWSRINFFHIGLVRKPQVTKTPHHCVKSPVIGQFSFLFAFLFYFCFYSAPFWAAPPLMDGEVPFLHRARTVLCHSTGYTPLPFAAHPDLGTCHLAKYLRPVDQHPFLPVSVRACAFVTALKLQLFKPALARRAIGRGTFVAEQSLHLQNVLHPEYGPLGPVCPRPALRQPDLHSVVPGGRHGHSSCCLHATARRRTRRLSLAQVAHDEPYRWLWCKAGKSCVLCQLVILPFTLDSLTNYPFFFLSFLTGHLGRACRPPAGLCVYDLGTFRP